jgi:hypothetical protein
VGRCRRARMGPQFEPLLADSTCGVPAVSVCTLCEGPSKFVRNGIYFFAVMAERWPADFLLSDMMDDRSTNIRVSVATSETARPHNHYRIIIGNFDNDRDIGPIFFVMPDSAPVNCSIKEYDYTY